MSIIVNEDYKDLLRSFNDAGVEYLLVGAHAVAFYGYPRYSADFDVWVRPNEENAKRVWRALTAFGAPMERLSIDDFTAPDMVIQIGVAPVRVDILTSIEAIAFGDAWRERTDGSYGDVPVPVIGRAQLIANKRATGRTKDQGDAEELERLGEI